MAPPRNAEWMAATTATTLAAQWVGVVLPMNAPPPLAVSCADCCRTATTEGCCIVMNDCWLAVDEFEEFDELSELNAAVANELQSPVLNDNICVALSVDI